ncbi:preprotein translocase subunit SecG [Candidatus Roizmanbacteria bacterium RIFCSPLOWO2_01_FULL_45_11]|uniref:Protein-export membrane protein SecG n=1 Tax=Candidatus Roizmanbacteria bacterium RIFCSPLOWO2_01_FULL_45_11 TaxID=1802070 RepID=A0A1F7JIY0_9BACT|nr:MAG: preprotein translocase subunit SecG [Candidatus Roizmanbacteria bacterium RIFCSPLOWO2_01_FULL_45_11]
MSTIGIILQIIVSISLIGLIAIQGKGGGLGSSFGGSITTFSKRRGVEKFVFQLTIGMTVLFLVLSIINLLV